MKKILPVLVLLIIGYCASTQDLKNNAVSENSFALNKTVQHTSDIYSNSISIKAIRNFKKRYKNIDDEKWHEMPDGWRATFILEDVRYRLDYDIKGNWLHTIKYYTEKKLPLEVRRLVASSYLDYNIRTVEEIEIPKGSVFYIVHLEGLNKWINIKVCEFEIIELENIRKA